MAPHVVVLDTETTGLGPREGREDGVVQVGLATRNPENGQVETFSSVCNPGERYMEDGRAREALAINGLSEGQVLSAPPAADVATRLRERLDRLRERAGDLELRCYNLSFDRFFLEADPWQIGGPWGPCLMKLAEARLNWWKWPRLEEAMEALDLAFPGEGAHDAGADAHAALLVHEALEDAGGPGG